MAKEETLMVNGKYPFDEVTFSALVLICLKIFFSLLTNAT